MSPVHFYFTHSLSNGIRCDNYRETEELMLWSSISISVKQEMITLSFDWHVPTTQGGWIKIRKCQKRIGYKTSEVMRVLNVEFWRFMKTLWFNAVCCYLVTCIYWCCVIIILLTVTSRCKETSICLTFCTWLSCDTSHYLPLPFEGHD